MSNAVSVDTSTENVHSVHELPFCSNIVRLPISDVLPADSPLRTAGANSNHIHALSESEVALPPIVVHRATMQVVDGWHRLRAAQLRGETTIAAVFFDGSPAEAFVLAVKLNAAHGLPLSLADRKAAALRILLSYPDWSDRSIAAIAGISHTTAAAIRSRSTGRSGQSTGRIARNGVVHRLNGQQGRRRAAELFTADPNASARKVALAAGISVTTAKDVRKRLRSGEQPAESHGAVVGAASAATGELAGNVRSVPQAIDAAEVLHRLRRDPSLRFTDTGRRLLRWLETPFEDGLDWHTVARSLPSHCTRSIAELARQRSRDWQRLADLLDRRS
ncbi:ParB/RepB/Spo0J family partition protein [Nocardia terpenica]|uniref:Streptomycin biosynthesis protein n=1 Tax=Nocardia terpenica TaxID=455432 RepID=A0A6G9YZR7_9NOCA|nr:ParB N-terminal domain-containing protein [Nocardia terpenica]QIS18313.1 streptomycin biosynthesis protein [Nocardia terpenica]